ncbi:hypothetical protein [Bacillus sp. JJ1122]|uniref:hypothetical protein n=1 Tax=Bacillus sp. JJ1122 TaxID=3122951 RepID=UPI00300084FD
MKNKTLFILTTLLIALMLSSCQQDEKEPAKESKASAENKANNHTTADKNGFTADDKVVTIEGKVLSYEDLQFYQLMNKVEIELNRQQDEQKLQEDELKDKQAYWDEQLKYHDNFNVNLSKMIEQHSMYLLAMEKGLKAEGNAVSGAIKEFSAKVEKYEPAAKLVADFPEDAYQNRLNSFFTEKLLTQQIYAILKTDAAKEKPNASEKELAYDTSKNYEELYQSQIASLDIKINAAEKE